MGLRPPFLAQFEVLDGQVGDELALLIGHADDDFHQVRFGPEDGACCGMWADDGTPTARMRAAPTPSQGRDGGVS